MQMSLSRIVAPGLAAALLALGSVEAAAQSAEVRQKAGAASVLLEQSIARRGAVRVIIQHTAAVKESALTSGVAGMEEAQATVTQAREWLLSSIGGGDAAKRERWSVTAASVMPLVAMTVNSEELGQLAREGRVVRIWADGRNAMSLDKSVPLVGAKQPASAPPMIGADGHGTTVAILDTGVLSSHPFLTGRVTHEACFSANVKGQSVSLCPTKGNSQIGAGAAAPCGSQYEGCEHGTHVAGIAAGKRTGSTGPQQGVAPGANIMAVQVFSTNCEPVNCPEIGVWDSDSLAALNYVLQQHPRIPGGIAAVNMSLGNGEHTAACDDHPNRIAVEALRAAGVAVVISANNNGFKNAVGAPGCISAAVTVGSSTKDDRISDFSNMSPLVKLMAPGSNIVSSVLGGQFKSLDGTSMAAPHVTGAFAVIRSKLPKASADEIEAALKETGQVIRDTRPGGQHAKPRIRVDAALALLTKTQAPVASRPAPPPPQPAAQPQPQPKQAPQPAAQPGQPAPAQTECGDVAERARSAFTSGVNEPPAGCR